MVYGCNEVGEEVTEADRTNGLDWIEPLGIIVAVVVIVVVTALNDWCKERSLRGLKKNVDREHTISVLRDAEMTQQAVADIVVGDICFIKYGNLPASSLKPAMEVIVVVVVLNYNIACSYATKAIPLCFLFPNVILTHSSAVCFQMCGCQCLVDRRS